MKRSSLAWYVALACLGGTLCVGSVVQADSPTTVKASSIVPTTVTTQAEQVALKQKQQYQADTETMGLLWMRTSAEYRALVYQGYNVALNIVKMAVYDPSHQRKPLAIVLDADETVVDNTKLMGESIANGNGRFDGPWWRAAVHKGESRAMPGAVEFLN